MSKQTNAQKYEQVFRPIDVVLSIHNGLRRGFYAIDRSVLSTARAHGDMIPTLDKLGLLGELLGYHAKGEEAAVFPAVDKLTPFVSQAYLIDHRELDDMINGFEAIRETPDALDAARATAVINSQLRIHLDKEDVHLYPILRERSTDNEQISIGQVMSSKIPPERFPILGQLLLSFLDLDDQVNLTKGWMILMPPPVFAMAKQLIKKNVGGNWVKIKQQIPGLTD